VPAAQRRGLGHHLLTELVRRAELSGIRSLLLEVRADNVPARNLYERGGFDVISVRRRYYRGGIDALVMRRLIGGTHA
jgi:ribosomal-protein-alanine N-acetyltransferase